VVIKIAEILWVEYRNVDVPVLEDVLLKVFVRILLILLVGPDIFLWTQLMIVVEALDGFFAVTIPAVFVATIPEVNMPVDNKYFFF
jgi:hypothetical protein